MASKNWANKALKQYQKEKLFKEVMSTQAAKDAQKEFETQAVLEAMVRISYIVCVYLESEFGFKKKRLTKALKFIKKQMEEIGKDGDFFVDVDEYYKSKLGLDVLDVLSLEKVEEKADD